MDSNMIETSSKQNTRKTHMILDTSYFIKLKPLNLLEGWKYYTTDYIVKEIRDEKAREFYNLNKDFIQIKTPTKESFIKVSQFAKQSNDLANLSLPDLSIISLAYEIINQEGLGESIRKEPMNYEVVMKETKQKKEEKEEVVWEDEGEWITSENIDKKINEKLKVTQEDPLEKEVNVYICSADFTVQNLSLKMGIPVMGIDGYRIKKIKNYIYKCYTCNTFIFDTTRKFCDFCGYPTLMKIGYNVSQTGKIKINDKKPDSRLRGTQYDLPKPSLSKKGVVYILSEDQLPKKRNEFNLEQNLDKVLDTYDKYKEINTNKTSNINSNSSKQFIWGYPKKNPNKSKKYYSKK